MKNVLAAVASFSSLALLTGPQISHSEELKAANLPSIVEGACSLVSPSESYKHLSEFRSTIAELCKNNGAEDKYVNDTESKVSDALEALSIGLNPDFDRSLFNVGDLAARCNLCHQEIRKYGFFLSDLQINSDHEDGSHAVLIVSLEKTIKTESTECASLDFSEIGCKTNPFEKGLLLVKSINVFSYPTDNPPPCPVSAFVFDPVKLDFFLYLGDENLKAYLPSYANNPEKPLDPELKKFLVNWAAGRMAFQLSKNSGQNQLPNGIGIGPDKGLLRNTMGLHFALQQTNEINPQIASIVYNFLCVNAKDIEQSHAARLSSKVIAGLKAKHLALTTISSSGGLERFFESHPDVAEKYIIGLKASLKRAVKKIKEDTELRKAIERQKNTV